MTNQFFLHWNNQLCNLQPLKLQFQIYGGFQKNKLNFNINHTKKGMPEELDMMIERNYCGIVKYCM